MGWPPFRPGAGPIARAVTSCDRTFDHETGNVPPKSAPSSRRGPQSGGSTADTTGDDPERTAAMQAMLRTVRATIDRLPAGQRSALLLVCRHGLSYRDAAEAMGVPIGAFADHLRQAREAVQAGLQRETCWPDDQSSGRYENGALHEDR